MKSPAYCWPSQFWAGFQRKQRVTAMSKADEQVHTLSVPEAGRKYFGLAEDASYRAAKAGDIPVIKVGGRKRVPVIAIERMLENPPKLDR
jgi:hypothetical protein